MKRTALAFIVATANLQALAHDGHGVDGGSALHYFSGAHLLIPAGIAVVAFACYVGVKRHRERR